MKNIVFGVVSVIFFIFYFKMLLLAESWGLTTNTPIYLFIIIFVIIPLSVISAQQAIKIIKES